MISVIKKLQNTFVLTVPVVVKLYVMIAVVSAIFSFFVGMLGVGCINVDFVGMKYVAIKNNI